MRKNSGNILLIVLVVAGILAASVGGYFWWSSKDTVPYTKQTSDTKPKEATPSADTLQIVCGTITGIHCPTGYTCKLDGNYPDAAGKCVKQSGIFGKVTIGPTCPGPEGPGRICTKLYVGMIAIGKQIQNQTKLGDFEEITRFQTDSDGSFRASLPAGDYVAKRLDNGAIYGITKTPIHVEENKFSEVNILFDTGIR